MDQMQCREKLGNLIKDEHLALNELSTLLDREHGFLEANDVTSLEGATRERQRCVTRIFRVDEERRALCRDMGRDVDLKGLEDLLRWCDPKGTLAGSWALRADRARGFSVESPHNVEIPHCTETFQLHSMFYFRATKSFHDNRRPGAGSRAVAVARFPAAPRSPRLN